MIGLIDANIVIDLMRQYPPALQWMNANPTLLLGIPVMVRFELVFGARNKNEYQKILKTIALYPVINLTETDSQWVMIQFEKFHLSHQIEIVDCFVGATAARLGLPIYTRNVRDFQVLRAFQL
jgi:predicted nucleic acid-binding protein